MSASATALPAPGPAQSQSRQRVAVIGGGIAGMGAAWLLHPHHDVTLFEKDRRLGGHSNTVDAVHDDGRRIPVDTGFIVYNQKNYPNLTALFDTLGVPTQPSDMSFAVSLDQGRMEWAGDNPLKLFGQPSNLVRPAFLRMVRDILRFNAAARFALRQGRLGGLTLGQFLKAQRYGPELSWHYLLPMTAAIWSAAPARMLDFPAESLLRFLDNHGLLELRDRPAWRTVSGGSRRYVHAIAAALGKAVHTGRAAMHVFRAGDGVSVIDDSGQRQLFDQVVLACHADQALAALADGDARERACLGAFRYQANDAVLHRDTDLMPRRRRLWSSWNYLADSDRQGGTDDSARVSVTYWMNRLQGLDRRYPLFVSLNPLREPDPGKVFARFRYNHPVFDSGAIAAQRSLGAIQGRRRTWFCGSWCGHGFHEDALASAVSVGLALGAAPPWRTTATAAGIARPAGTGAPAPARRMTAGAGQR